MNDPIYRAPAPMADEQYYELTGEEMPMTAGHDTAPGQALDVSALLAEAIAAETEPCRLDHNGDCQEHGWFGGECLIPRARRALAARTTAPGTEASSALRVAIGAVMEEQENAARTYRRLAEKHEHGTTLHARLIGIADQMGASNLRLERALDATAADSLDPRIVRDQGDPP